MEIKTTFEIGISDYRDDIKWVKVEDVIKRLNDAYRTPMPFDYVMIERIIDELSQSKEMNTNAKNN